MTRRTICGTAAAALVVAIGAAHLTAQAPATPSRNRRVWTGTIDDRQIILNEYDSTPIRRPVRFFQDVQVSFTFVSEDDPDRPGFTKWLSRRLTWQAFAHSSSSVQGTECQGGDSLDLGPADGADMVTPEQEARLKIRCRDWHIGNVWAFILSPNPKVHLPIIQEMTNCEPTRRWTAGGVRYTLSVSPTEPQGSFRFAYFDAEHAPVPGGKFKLRGESNVLGRWRFVVESSRLRGYATNADISSAFFDLYPGASSMRGKYGTLDPDLVFDPAQSAEQGSEWKPPSPDRGPRKWSVIESTDQTSVNRAEVDLTAMDFGAHGEVRAYISPACGGGWMQVPMEHGGSFAKYPTKDDDGNFMSDLEQNYRGLAALSDEDAEPKGDGPGDGFTAFEEYRGFVVPLLTSCRSPLERKHVRTSPKQKTLFIHVSDPVLSFTALAFADTSGLQVRGICPAEYVDDDTRIVNFTMHTFPGQLVIGEGLRGTTLTQAEPQHGLHLVNQTIGGGVLGQSIAVDPAGSGIGPPRHVKRVAIDLPAIRAAYGLSRQIDLTTVITHHELGHAIGIGHHGDKNHVGPIALLTTPGCTVGMIEGTVDGQPACTATGIALEGQQNSGNASCPMKYLHWSWYVPRPSALVYSRMVDFIPDRSWHWQRSERPARLPGYEGPVARYRKDLDEAPDPVTMTFCTTRTGTGINALPGDQNHAGHAERAPSCALQLRVKDLGR